MTQTAGHWTNMPPIDPCAKAAAGPAAAAAGAAARENAGAGPQLNMGPQSQRRLTSQERTHQLQSQSHGKKKQTGQQTLFGDKAFDPTKNCPKCRGGPSSHKGHGPRCWNNKRKSKSLQAMEDQRPMQHFAAPPLESEKRSGKCLTKEAAASFFAPREAAEGRPHASVNVTGVAVRMTTTTTTTTTAMATSVQSENVGNDVTVTAFNLHNGVASLVQDSNFAQAVDSSRAPLPMLAFAKLAADQMIRQKGSGDIRLFQWHDHDHVTTSTINHVTGMPFNSRSETAACRLENVRRGHHMSTLQKWSSA